MGGYGSILDLLSVHVNKEFQEPELLSTNFDVPLYVKENIRAIWRAVF